MKQNHYKILFPEANQKGLKVIPKVFLPPNPPPPHLESKAASVEAALVHGGVLPDKALAEAALLVEEEVPVAVVVQQSLGQVEQGSQLT